MQFDNQDKKFREAAENHHPPYDEKAWSKMEKLLDRHMPPDKNKRRFIFISLVLAGLLVTGLLILQPWNTTSNRVADSKLNENPKASKNFPADDKLPVSLPLMDEKIPDPRKETTTPAKAIHDQLTKQVKPGSTSPAIPFSQRSKPLENKRNAPGPLKPRIQEKEPADAGKASVPIFSAEQQKPGTEPASTPVEQKRTANKTGNLTTVNSPGAKKQDTVTQKPVMTKAADRRKKTHDFFFTAGGGPDVSFVRLDRPGTIKLFAGAGVGYIYNNRISLRAGFYSGRKIYNAGADDYNAPASFYAYYPYLQEVQADCKINEVPVLLSYHFARNSKKQFFVSAGLSSYFMKTEKYEYYYKYTPTGPTYMKDRTISNVNRHYFAGLHLSAGYTRSIRNRVKLTVEPYTKIPLKGVGYGNVKLNSSGVMFSVGIHPFVRGKADQ